jgi:hypothetical protein
VTGRGSGGHGPARNQQALIDDLDDGVLNDDLQELLDGAPAQAPKVLRKPLGELRSLDAELQEVTPPAFASKAIGDGARLSSSLLYGHRDRLRCLVGGHAG